MQSSPPEVFFNPHLKPVGEGASLSLLSLAQAQSIRRFHATFKEYAPTPFHSLTHLAQHLNIKHLLVKDESHRFGLNAFKVLGGSYAMARYLAQRFSLEPDTLSQELLCSPALSEKIGDITFTTTTDGNHGRGIAWTAEKLQRKAIVYMPKGSAAERVENIRKHGAQCTVADLNYDDTVRMNWALAQERGHVMVQDTAWEGYEDIPTWIMQGYMTMTLEALEQMAEQGIAPTHVFVQAGVGAHAGAALGLLASALQPHTPKFIVVEPHNANCVFTSAKKGDGQAHTVTGELQTIMAGLACGEPSTISWPLLRDYACAFISAPDYLTANGMRILACPLKGDTPITSGESGAVSTGIVHWLLTDPQAQAHREGLGLGEDSSVLVFSTEGDTAPEVYRKVVWQGMMPDAAVV
eukprot:comp20033_c0_seq1/m.24586 comp20033_c0_seq1/g.24586  ORF comp20033_c0_seq1/g.24586 comp20033_c0_seq1/m.24586 type:complete len:409 (-) comp20033_c0_seq1:338-1564(-)